MKENQPEKIKKKRILPRKPLLPTSGNSERDRLAWALSRGWLKPVDGRRLTVYVIESRKGLPLHVRIRDWVLMSFAWIAWGVLLIDVVENNPAEMGQLIGPGLWTHDIARGLFITFSIAGGLIFILANFGIYTLYRLRNPKKEISEPESLTDEEQASCCGLDMKALKEWRMARRLSVDINDEGKLAHYEVFPKEVPDDLIL